MKTKKYLLVLLCTMFATALQAQVMRVHYNDNYYEPGYVSKFYLQGYDSIVHVPAQDWSISHVNTEKYMSDGQINALVRLEVGPNAHQAVAVVLPKNAWASPHDVLTGNVEAMQTFALVPGIRNTFSVRIPAEGCQVLAYTTNNIYTPYDESHGMYNMFYPCECTVDLEPDFWGPWCSTLSEWIAAGLPAEQFPMPESTGTCTYTYASYWNGSVHGLRISYRQDVTNPTKGQFKVDDWGMGMPFYIDYNAETGKVSVPVQKIGSQYSNGEDIVVSDVSTWQGQDFSQSYPCTYDPERGRFDMHLAYWLSLGSFGYDVESIQIDGYYIPYVNGTATHKHLLFMGNKDYHTGDGGATQLVLPEAQILPRESRKLPAKSQRSVQKANPGTPKAQPQFIMKPATKPVISQPAENHNLIIQ